MKEKVVILGASDNPDRFSNKAMKSLLSHGHDVVLVSPNYSEIDGHKVYAQLKDINEPVDTLTMYVGAKISSTLTDQILSLSPKRVIFNPGSENPELTPKLKEKGIASENACTLVLLRTNQF